MDAARRSLVVAGPALVLATGAASAPRPVPRRIVSLNPCLDEVLVQVADRSQIAALSHYARDPEGSTIAALAHTFPQTYESAEEVMVLQPDLVLASRHTALPTREALGRLGVPVEPFGVPVTVKASLDDVLRMARLVGHPERGVALAARIRAAIAAAAPPAGARPITALVFQPKGFAAGDGVLISEMLRDTGFVSVGARYGVQSWGVVPLERVISHPALKAVAGRMRRIVFPESLLYCGGPTLIETARLLAEARRQVEAHP